jgi:hypothetical protein
MAGPDFEQKDDNSWEYVDQNIIFFIKKLRRIYSIEAYSITGKKLIAHSDVLTEDEMKIYCLAFVEGWIARETNDQK